MNKKHPGNISLIVLVSLGMTYFFFDKIINLVLLHNMHSQNIILEEQANLLIYAGFSIGLCQIEESESGIITSKTDSVNKEAENAQKPITEVDRLRSMYATLLPILNKWQTFEFNEKEHGLEATIELYLSCEQGKYNLGQLFNYEKQEIIEPFKTIFSKIQLKNFGEKESLEQNLAEYLKRNKEQILFDPSELKTDKKISFFYRAEDKESVKKSPTLVLFDLFTIMPSTSTLLPFFLSKSVLTSINITEDIAIEEAESEAQKNIMKKIETIDSSWSENNWKNHLKDLEDFFNTKPSTPNDEKESEKAPVEQGISVLQSLFGKEVEPEYFSLISTVKFLEIKKSACIIFKRETIATKYNVVQKKDANTVSDEQNAFNFKKAFFVPDGFEILRIYWL